MTTLESLLTREEIEKIAQAVQAVMMNSTDGWGNVNIEFRAGKIFVVRAELNLKPEKHP